MDGTRERTVYCETTPEGIVIPDMFCDCDLKPPSSEACTNIDGLGECYLIPIWRTGEFSEVRLGGVLM